MGCEAPRNDIEQIVCDLESEEQQREIDAAVSAAQNSLRSERSQISSSLESSQTSIEKVRETVEYIGQEERLFIIEYFGIPANPDGFVAGVLQLQANMNFTSAQQDGVVGPYTLRNIYERYYQYDYEKLGTLQQWRLTTYNEIGIRYPDWTRYVMERESITTLRVENLPDIFNKNYYFGATEGIPLEGGFINSEIFTLVPSVIPERINTSGVHAFLRNIDGKYIICVYINGELTLASYSSPGSTERYGPNAATPQLTRSVSRVDNRVIGELTTMMHYISGGSDSVRNSPNSDGSFTSDPMPLAVGIKPDSGIYTHAGYVDAGARSHGCPRLPAHYTKGLYEIFKIHGEIHWDTHINNPIS